MRKYTRLLSGALVAAALAALFLSAARGRDDDDAEKAMKTAAARAAVLKLVGDLGNAAVVKREAADVAAKHDIEFVMNQFRPRNKGGLGVGAAPARPSTTASKRSCCSWARRRCPRRIWLPSRPTWRRWPK